MKNQKLNLKLEKLSFVIKSKKPHFFIGSKIRGILGYALKDQVCINPSFICKDCFALDKCIFYKFYEQQNITHNYRLDFKLYDDKYKFKVLLFEDSISYKDDIQKAMLKSLSEHKDIKFKTKTKEYKSSKNYSSVIKLEFLTPLRIKKANKFAIYKDDITLNDILFSIYRRYLDIKKEPFKRIEFNKDIKLISNNFKYQEITRKSNKQNSKMNFGGLMGEMILSGVDKQTYDLLKLGEMIGVGKQTVFGLGKIKIEDIN
jgi:CRISPR-associated endoribonuclease Cas6